MKISSQLIGQKVIDTTWNNKELIVYEYVFFMDNEQIILRCRDTNNKREYNYINDKPGRNLIGSPISNLILSL